MTASTEQGTRYFKFKALFDPLSEEWGMISYSDRLELLREIFVVNYDNIDNDRFISREAHKDVVYRNKDSLFRINHMIARDLENQDKNFNYHEPKHEDDDKFDNESFLKRPAKEKQYLPPIGTENLTLAVSLYLEKLYDAEFVIPDFKIGVEIYHKSIKNINDGRLKQSKELQAYLLQKRGGDTRELFDLGSSQYQRSDVEKKKDMFGDIVRHGFLPGEILFYHYLYYKSMGEEYKHVTDQLPYSAIAFLWDGNNLLLPEKE